MADANPEMISVPFETLNRLMKTMLGGDPRATASVEQFGDDIRTLNKAVENHIRLKYNPKEIKVGDIVQPKEGRNYLRAGDTAYDHAVVIGLNPLLLISGDGKVTWHKSVPSDFNIIGKISEMELSVLRIIVQGKNEAT